MENFVNVYSGSYKGTIDGVNSTLIITQEQNSIKGELYRGSSKYDLTGVVISNSIHGKLTDTETHETYIVLAEFNYDGSLRMELIMHNIEKSLSESNTYIFVISDNNEITIKQNTKTEPVNNIDIKLVGTWAKDDMLSANEITLHTKMLIELDNNGNYKILGARKLDGYRDTGYSGDTTTGKWKTINNTFYIQVSGSRHWKPYATYKIKGPNLIFTLGDQDRQVWSRTTAISK